MGSRLVGSDLAGGRVPGLAWGWGWVVLIREGKGQHVCAKQHLFQKHHFHHSSCGFWGKWLLFSFITNFLTEHSSNDVAASAGKTGEPHCCFVLANSSKPFWEKLVGVED